MRMKPIVRTRVLGVTTEIRYSPIHSGQPRERVVKGMLMLTVVHSLSDLNTTDSLDERLLR